MLDAAALGDVPWGNAGIVGVCIALIGSQLRMIFSGKFVPREQVDLITADLRARVAYLEQASTLKDTTINEQAAQITKLGTQADLSVRVLEAIAARSGSGHVATD